MLYDSEILLVLSLTITNYHASITPHERQNIQCKLMQHIYLKKFFFKEYHMLNHGCVFLPLFTLPQVSVLVIVVLVVILSTYN